MAKATELSEGDERRLVLASIDGMHKAYTSNNKPDDRRFGAAVLTTEGNVYRGGGYHSDTYSLLLHAEQSALAHAAANGEYWIKAIAVTCNFPERADEAVYPCHMCKQLLWENHLRTQINVCVIMHDDKGKVLERVNLLDMISHPWPRRL